MNKNCFLGKFYGHEPNQGEGCYDKSSKKILTASLQFYMQENITGTGNSTAVALTNLYCQRHLATFSLLFLGIRLQGSAYSNGLSDSGTWAGSKSLDKLLIFSLCLNFLFWIMRIIIFVALYYWKMKLFIKSVQKCIEY